MSPELETLDQLQSGDLSLAIIANLFPSSEDCGSGVCSLLSSGDVILTMLDGTEVPEWRWRELFRQQSVFGELERLRLKITPQGVRRIG